METRHRLPLRDLPLEQFLTPNITKTPRKYKRPLSPSHTPLNPAKRRVLDAEGILPTNNAVKPSPSHPVPFVLSSTVTPAKPSRLGNGLVRHYGGSQGPFPSHRRSLAHELYPKLAIESSTDPQSKHYPGFDVFRDSEHCRGSSFPRVSLPSGGDAQANRTEEGKENMPLRKKAKRLSSKKRLLSGFDGSDAPYLGTPVQSAKVVLPERTPFSPRQAPR